MLAFFLSFFFLKIWISFYSFQADEKATLASAPDFLLCIWLCSPLPPCTSHIDPKIPPGFTALRSLLLLSTQGMESRWELPKGQDRLCRSRNVGHKVSTRPGIFFPYFHHLFFFTSLELSLKCSHIRGPNSFRAERDFPKVIQASIEQKPDPKRPVWIRNCGTPPLRKRFTYTQHLIRGKPIFALH